MNNFLIFRGLSILLLAFIAGFVLIVPYNNIADVPFYLDDFSSIVNNPAINPPFSLPEIWQQYQSRFLTYSSFATQTHFFGILPKPMHLVGLALHFLVSLCLYRFLTCIRKNSVGINQSAPLKRGGFLFCLSVSLLFFAHPQNSQAVVYIAQQAVLWMVLFYLLSLICYVNLRKETSLKKQLIWGLMLTLCAICALFSKQTAATLPIAILLIEWLFFKRYVGRCLVLLGAMLLGSILLVLSLNEFDVLRSLTFLDVRTRETELITRSDYFITQWGILWHYIQQYFTLSEFRLEYDVTLNGSLSDQHVMFLLGHLLMMGISLLCRKVNPLFTFGVLFYYLSHGIESSILPIRDLVFEHRTYLPNIGLSIAFLSAVNWLVQRFHQKTGFDAYRLMYATFTAMLLHVSIVTQDRVEQWSDPSVFYQQEMALSPKSARATGEYANALARQGNCPLALGYYSHALALYESRHQSSLGAQPEMIVNYITCLRGLKIYGKAEYWEDYLLDQVNEPIRRSHILGKRGLFFLQQKEFEKAVNALNESFQLNNKDYAVAMNLAISLVNLGQYKAGENLLRHALILRPSDQVAQQLLERLTSMQR